MGIYDGYAERALQDGGYRPTVSNADFEATLGEVRRASASYQELTGLTTSEENFYREPLRNSLLKLQEQRQQENPDFMFVPHTRANPRGDPDMAGATISELRRIASENSESLTEIGATTMDELDQRYQQQVQKAQRGMALAGQRSGLGTMLAGSLAGGAQAEVKDPLTWMTLGIGGAYKGGSLVKYALTEAMLQGGVNVGIEASVLASNQELYERAGVQPDVATNLLLAGGAGAVLAGPFSGIGARIDRAQVEKTVQKIAEATGAKTVDDAAMARIQSLRRSGYQFDPKQEHIIADGMNMKRLADENMAGRPMDEAKATARGVDATERGLVEEGADIDGATATYRGAGRYQESETVGARLNELRQRVAEREAIEVRDRPSKPLKRMLRELEGLESKAAKAQEAYEGTAARAVNARQAVDEAGEAVDLAHGRWRRALRESTDRTAHLRDQVERLSAKLTRLEGERTPSKRRIKTAREKLGAANDELDEANAMLRRRRQEFDEARETLAKAGERQRQAESDLSELMDDADVLSVVNKGNRGFTYKAPAKADKGDVPRRVDPAEAPRTSKKPYRGEQPKPREAGPVDEVDDAALSDLQRRYEAGKERIEPKEDSAAAEVAESIEEGNKMLRALDEVMACNGGGE